MRKAISIPARKWHEVSTRCWSLPKRENISASVHMSVTTFLYGRSASKAFQFSPDSFAPAFCPPSALLTSAFKPFCIYTTFITISSSPCAALRFCPGVRQSQLVTGVTRHNCSDNYARRRKHTGSITYISSHSLMPWNTIAEFTEKRQSSFASLSHKRLRLFNYSFLVIIFNGRASVAVQQSYLTRFHLDEGVLPSRLGKSRVRRL